MLKNIDIGEFTKKYNTGASQIIYNDLPCDLETPVSVYLKTSKNEKNSFIMESVEGGNTRGRYSFIGIKPDLIWKYKNNKVEICYNPEKNDGFIQLETTNPLVGLRELLAQSAIDLPIDAPPMAAGLIGYLGYDTIRFIEDIPQNNSDPIDTPDGIFMRPTIIIVFDNVNDIMKIITPVRYDKDITAIDAFNMAVERIHVVTNDLADYSQIEKAQNKDLDELTSYETNITNDLTQTEYEDMVLKAKEYIKNGDVFQVVLSQRFSMDFPINDFSLYRSLRSKNPSPFSFYLKFDDFSVVGSSPEILVRLRNSEITIRPIAGTRVRGKDKDEDLELAADLLSDEKELAEHLMLLDLGRNDVGKFAKINSVKVTDQFFIEYYSHVMHIVSNVIGKIKDEFDGLDALSSGFPAGTVSGAPKVRAMEIINELEPYNRGIYGGCIGYFGADGNMDTCITLRTGIVKDKKLYIQAGAGIVADSVATAEYFECVNKAKALISAAKYAISLHKNKHNL